MAGFIIIFAVLNSAIIASHRNPPYRIITDGSEYVVQERMFWFYTDKNHTYSKDEAIRELQEYDEIIYRREHPPVWVVVSTTNK